MDDLRDEVDGERGVDATLRRDGVQRESFYLSLGAHTIFTHFESPRSARGELASRLPGDPAAQRSADALTEASAGDGSRVARDRSWVGVVLMPTFGNDDLCSYRIRYEWARKYVERGMRVVRFDLPGAGNSSDVPDEADLVEAWTEATACVLAWLRGQPGCGRLAAIGLGLGGVLACQAAAFGAVIDDLVLWATPARGRTAVREIRAFAAVQAVTQSDHPRAARSLVAGGFLLGAGAIAALEAIDLAEAGTRFPAVGRALLLGRDGAHIDEGLCSALESAGVPVTRAVGQGYGAMVIEPQRAQVPIETVNLVGDWIEAENPRQTVSASYSPAISRDVLLSAEEYVEEPLWIELAGFGRAFAVLTRPHGPARLTAVLLNAGALRHIGPSRMWVRIARRWAKAGIATARVDLEGIGDADGESAPLRSNEALYREIYRKQIQGVIDHLVARRLPGKVVLVGLCAGAYWALDGALCDDRVAGAYLINPRVLEYAPDIGERRAARQLLKVRRLATWRRLISGQIALGQVLTALRAAPRAALRGRLKRSNVPAEGVLAKLSSLSARGVEVLGVFSDREPVYEELQQGGELEAINCLPHIRFETLTPLIDSHMLESLDLQDDALRRLDQALQRTLAQVSRELAPVAGASGARHATAPRSSW